MKRNRDSFSSDGAPQVNSIFRGEVVSLQPYGIFVKIPGCEKNGLVHISQISNSRVERPEDVVELKEKIYCKVISVEPDGQKISLSMKVVNQTTGHDLDPTQLQTSKDEQHRKKDFKREFPKIELGAVFDTTCKKCGGKGHLAQDCFHVPGSKTYDLVEEVFEWPAKTQDVQSTACKKHKKKEKKERRKHKKKHRKDQSSSKTERPKKEQDSSSSNSEDDSSSPDLRQENQHHRKTLRDTLRPEKEESPDRRKHSWSKSSSEKHGHRSEHPREHSGSRKRHRHHSPSPSEKKRK